MTRIIVAFPKAENGKNIKNVLVRNGYQVVCVCTNGAQVIQEANGLQDGIVPFKDIFIGDTISGVMRLIETILWAAALALGFALAGWLLGV